MGLLQPLTDDETALAKKAKDQANERIQKWRAEKVKELAKKYARKADRDQQARKQLPLLSGLPVILTDGEHAITVDYDDLYRFTRKVRSGWNVTMQLASSRGKVELAITYRHQNDPRRNGMARLYGLQDIHLQALQGLELPTVQVFS